MANYKSDNSTPHVVDSRIGKSIRPKKIGFALPSLLDRHAKAKWKRSLNSSPAKPPAARAAALALDKRPK